MDWRIGNFQTNNTCLIGKNYSWEYWRPRSPLIVVLKSVMALTGVERSAEVTDGVRTVETLHAKIVVIPDAEMIDGRRIAAVMVDATRWAATAAIGAEDLAMTHCGPPAGLVIARADGLDMSDHVMHESPACLVETACFPTRDILVVATHALGWSDDASLCAFTNMSPVY